MPDSFSSAIPDTALPILTELGNEFGFDPLASVELEEYWAQFVRDLPSEVDLASEARLMAKRAFRSVAGVPAWEQAGEWPLENGEPMVFVGSICVPSRQVLFQDDSTFFVFYSPSTGRTRAIVQSA